MAYIFKATERVGLAIQIPSKLVGVLWLNTTTPNSLTSHTNRRHATNRFETRVVSTHQTAEQSLN